MHLPVLIAAAEEKYLILLKSFFSAKWGNSGLWSHDLSHHLRVWQYAQELLTITDNVFDQDFTDKLLIACYLHDIGMTVDTGEKHGKYSRQLCEEFLSRINKDPVDFTDLLLVIESHDNKSYKESSVPGKLFLFLSVADDLDAFGYIGIYRYLDIYLARGVEPAKTAQIVLKNAGSRFNYFEQNFNTYPELLTRHRKRYNILRDFFENLESEFASPLNRNAVKP